MQNDTEQQLICPHCRYIGQRERFSKGNWKLEIILWMMFFIPGALYTTWRCFNEYLACPVCKNEDMTPLNSSLGQKIARERERMNELPSKKAVACFLKKLFHGK